MNTFKVLALALSMTFATATMAGQPDQLAAITWQVENGVTCKADLADDARYYRSLGMLKVNGQQQHWASLKERCDNPHIAPLVAKCWTPCNSK